MKYLFDGKTMKEARKSSGLTQRQVSKELGITIRQYCRWEAGDVTLKDYQLDKLQDIFSYA